MIPAAKTNRTETENRAVKSRGFALVTTAMILILLGLAMIIYLAGMNIVENEKSVSSLIQMKANYLALSGIDWMIERARLYDPGDTTFQFGDGEVELTTEYIGAQKFRIFSKGRIGDYERSLSMALLVKQYSFFPDTTLVDRVTNAPGVTDTIHLTYPDYIKTFIVQGSPNTNFASSSFSSVGWQDNSVDESRMLLRFDLADVAYRTSLDTAILYYYKVPTFPPKPQNIAVHRILTDWVPGQATWNDKRTGLAWNTAGGDYDPAAETVTAVRDGGEIAWDVTASVRSFLNGSEDNNGWLLKDANPVPFRYSQFSNPIPPRLLLIFQGEPGVLVIEQDPVINGNFFVRDSVFVMNSDNIGQSPNGSTYIWVTENDIVYGYPYWGAGFEYPTLKINYPAITDTVQQLFNVAAGITSYFGNKFIVFTAPPTLDMSLFEDNTIYVRDSIVLKNTTILDMDYETPGYLVTNSYAHISNATIGKNIVILARDDINIDYSTIGSDFRGPGESAVNLLWSAEGDMSIGEGSTLYANAVSYSGNGILKSTLYGGFFVRDTATFFSNDVYLEGAFWVGKIRNNKLTSGQYKITGVYPDIFIDLPRVVQVVEDIH